MNKNAKWLFATAIAVLTTAILLWIFPGARPHALGQEQKGEEAAELPSRVSIQNGETVLTLDSETQSRLGLRVAPLHSISMREDLTAPAVVLNVQDLVAARTGYAEAQSRLEKARANTEVTRREYDRVKALYQDNQNASQKALQAAEGASRVDAAEVAAASQGLALQAAAVRQGWGSVVEEWVIEGGSTLEQLLAMQKLLVQVTLPAGQTFVPSQTVSIEIPGAGLANSSLVSQFPRIDPRLQGVSFLYSLPARQSLAPGMNLVAHLRVGRNVQGVIVPESAVVWWQGKAWVYQQTAPNRFIRRTAITETPVSGGFFVVRGFAPGDSVVVRGAQILLSEEYRPQVQSGGGADTD